MSSSNGDVQLKPVQWESFQGAEVITEHERNLIETLEGKSKSARLSAFQDDADVYVSTYLKLIDQIHIQDANRYTIHFIYNLLKLDKSVILAFVASTTKDPYKCFLELLKREDPFIIEYTYLIVSLMIEHDSNPNANHVQLFLDSIYVQLQYKPRMATKALISLLQVDSNRVLFYKTVGTTTLVELINTHMGDIQLMYEVNLCFWLLSFNKEVCLGLKKHHIVPVIHSCMKKITKEKVIRLGLMTFMNLLSKDLKSANYVNSMIIVGVPRTLMLLQKRKFADEDILECVNALFEKLEDSIEELSSFDEYRQEVLSGKMEWSPVHKSDKFWRESLKKFDMDDYAILKEVINLLDTSKDPQTLAICCFDLGQLILYHPNGRFVLQQLGAKTKVMKLMANQDQAVKREALSCVQKIMIQNWQYL